MSVTITTAVSVGSILSEPVAQLLAVLGTAFLIGLLVVRELLHAHGERLTGRRRAFVKDLNRGLSVAVPALFFIFALIVTLRVLDALQ